MADDPTTLAPSMEPARDGVPPVLDEAHIGDIRGALGTIRMTTRAPATAGARGAWRCWRSWAQA